jgi:hypothetical protein
VDLIVGLPGENLESFGRGFDRLVELGPQEIQVGILKRLRGTPIVRHDAEYQMVYSAHSPYEILQNREISFAEMQRMRRFSRYWDLTANSGRFSRTLPLLWNDAASPFARFLAFSDWLHKRLNRTHQIAVNTLAELLYEFLCSDAKLDRDTVRHAVSEDWVRSGQPLPRFLRPGEAPQAAGSNGSGLMKRQARHSSSAHV